MVIDPDGEILCDFGEEESFSFVTFDTEKTAAERDTLRTFESRRPDLYGGICG